MSGKFIATIYFYLLSLIGVVLIVIGVFNIVNLAVNLTQFDKYPLRYGSENCDNYPFSYNSSFAAPAKILPDGRESTPSAQELEKQQKVCRDSAEMERKQHRVEDIKNAIAFPLVGLLLFLIHFPQAKKRSI
jgi:hypothetical protein